LSSLIISCYNFEKQPNRFFLHGDYWPANILIEGKKHRIRGIIDWEFSRNAATAPTDIIWFLINVGYSLELHGKRRTDLSTAFFHTFFSHGKFTPTLASLYKRYVMAADASDYPFLFMLELTLAGISMRELAAYGKHGKMDQTIWKMFQYTIKNEDHVCL